MVETSWTTTHTEADRAARAALLHKFELREKVDAARGSSGLKLGDCGHYALETQRAEWFPDNDDIPRLWCFICREYRFWDIEIQIGFNGS